MKSSVLPAYSSKILVLGWDMFFAVLSLYVAILVTHNFDLESTSLFFSSATLLFLGLRLLVYRILRTYSIVIRYVGEKDYKNAFFGVTLSSLLFTLLILVMPDLWKVDNPMAVVLVDFFQVLLPTVGLRIALRYMYDFFKQRECKRQNTAIFGAGELGSLVYSVLQHNTSHKYKVVAFFDDDPKMTRKALNGIRVYDPRKDFDEVIRKNKIKVAIIGINGLPEKRRLEFIDACLANQVKVLKLPPVTSWINGNLNVGQLKKINTEDLLDREPIKLDEVKIAESVTNKVVMVTGCAGSIGSEIVRQLLKYQPRTVIGLDQAETPLAEMMLSLKDEVSNGIFQGVMGDVRDWDKLYRIFQEYRPDYVFHAAAYKHVPMMERFPDEAVKVNVLGTKNVADLSVKFGVDKFVMISTDKVVNPANIMGASKRIAEIYVQALNFRAGNFTQFITTRFGNVLGSNGSVIPIFKEQIENRRPVTVTHPEVTRFFMTIPEACQLVLEAGAMGNGGEIFVFDMGEPVRIVNLARKMILLAGLTPGKDIDIVFTGLRPGEKLYEELLDKQEGIIPTHHPKIMKAKVRTCSYEEVRPRIDGLVAGVSESVPSDILVSVMKEMVPEFASKNSEFAALDRKKQGAAS